MRFEATATSAASIPARGIDAWTRTIRNAYRAAKADGQPRFVGATYTTYFVSANPALPEVPFVRLKVDPDGTVSRKVEEQ